MSIAHEQRYSPAGKTNRNTSSEYGKEQWAPPSSTYAAAVGSLTVMQLHTTQVTDTTRHRATPRSSCKFGARRSIHVTVWWSRLLAVDLCVVLVLSRNLVQNLLGIIILEALYFQLTRSRFTFVESFPSYSLGHSALHLEEILCRFLLLTQPL